MWYQQYSGAVLPPSVMVLFLWWAEPSCGNRKSIKKLIQIGIQFIFYIFYIRGACCLGISSWRHYSNLLHGCEAGTWGNEKWEEEGKEHEEGGQCHFQKAPRLIHHLHIIKYFGTKYFEMRYIVFLNPYWSIRFIYLAVYSSPSIHFNPPHVSSNPWAEQKTKNTFSW